VEKHNTWFINSFKSAKNPYDHGKGYALHLLESQIHKINNHRPNSSHSGLILRGVQFESRLGSWIS
jgi:hypothetical protein